MAPVSAIDKSTAPALREEYQMKILLIEPRKPPKTIGGEDVFLFEPLALEYIAAGVLNDHDVRILDLRLDDGLERELAGFDPDIVGITAYTVHVNVVKKLFEKIKAENPRILTVAGGHHATVKPGDFLTPSIDLVVAGEGVFAFREIVSRFEKGEAFDDIPGVVCGNGGGNGGGSGGGSGGGAADPIIVKDLDSFPFPARSLTAGYRKHYYSEWMKPLASIRTSRGCPFRCRFCAQWKVAGGGYFKREPRKVVEELAGIEEENVFFADDESLIDVERMTDLARLIGEAGIRKRYFLYGRSDTIAGNPDLLRAWREIGLERVFVGFESFKDEDLAFIRKRSKSEDNEKAVEILHDLGIDIYASFIIQPGFTRDDFAALKKYCRRFELSFASFSVLTPLPGTDLYEEVGDQLITNDYDFFDFLHTLLPTSLPLEDFYAEYHNLYKYGIAPGRQLSFLRKYPVREIPGLLSKGRRFYKRLRTAYRDYED